MSRKHYRLSNGIVGRVSVVSLGEFNEDISKQMSWWHFERTGKHYRYQPGFHSKRPVTFPDGNKSGIDCMVVRLENVIAPRFKCSAVHPKSGLTIDVIESSASAAANKILDLLDVNTNKRWSGPEFFGFTKPEVARELMKDNEYFLPEHFNKRKKFIDDKHNAQAWNFSVGKGPNPSTKDILFSNLYAPTMVSSLAASVSSDGGVQLVKTLENGLPFTTISSSNSPIRGSDHDAHGLNGLALLNGNGHLPLMLSNLGNSTAHTSPVTSNTSPVSTGSRSEESLNVTWVELKSIGKTYHTPTHNWIYKHCNRRYRIQPGFTSLRSARNTTNEEVLIWSEIKVKDGLPLYKCSCKNASKEDTNSTKVVQEFLKDLDIPTKKSWAGPDFFGLTRSSVLQQLLCTEQEEKLCAITPTYLPSPISPARGNSSYLEPLSQYLDTQAYRSLMPAFSNTTPSKRSHGSAIGSPITGLSMPSLNGQVVPSSINSMLTPEILSPRFLQSLPNFMASTCTTVPHSAQSAISRSSFSRYMSINMTECVKNLKTFITSLYTLQEEDKLSILHLQKLNADMEQLVHLLKTEATELSQKINAIDNKTFVNSSSGYIKLECEESRQVNQSTETEPSLGINLELGKLREVEVQCNSCQNSVTFCSGCGGRLALYVPGAEPHATTSKKATTCPPCSSSTASVTPTELEPIPPQSSAGAAETTEEKSGWQLSPSVEEILSDQVCKKIKLTKQCT